MYFLLDRKTFGFYGSFTTTLSTNTHHPCLSHAVTSLLLILNRPKRIDLRKKREEKEKDPSVLDCMNKSIILNNGGVFFYLSMFDLDKIFEFKQD